MSSEHCPGGKEDDDYMIACDKPCGNTTSVWGLIT